MYKRLLIVPFFVTALLVLILMIPEAEAQKQAPKPVSMEACYGCHDTIKSLHTMGRHSKINCVNCHSGLEKHLAAPGPETRPQTDTSWEACGRCHKEQYNSFMQQAYHLF